MKTKGKAHATFGASSSARWLACPGSIELSKKAPPQKDSPHALEGTLAHECLEYALITVFIGEGKKETTGTWDKQMQKHAKDTVVYIQKRMAEHPGASFFAEHKVDASSFTCAEQFGTLDFAIVDEFNTLIIGDYKYGSGVVVEPKDNTQLIYYALAVAHKYHYNFSSVELVVIQPRAFHPSRKTERSHVMPISELLSHRKIFQEGVKRAQEPNAELRSGDHCRWCPAAVICPEIKNRNLRQAQVVFNDDPAALITVPKPEKILGKDLGQVLNALDQLEVWMKRVREHAFHQLGRGRTVSGWKLVKKRSTRKWKDEEKAAKWAKRWLGSSVFTPSVLTSPAQIEAKIMESESEFQEGWVEWLEENTTSESSGLTLVQDSDKRVSVDPMESTLLKYVTEGGKGGPFGAVNIRH